MAKFGNSGASSLIRAAEAEYNRVQAYNDSVASFEYDISAKTAEDYAKYKAYLDSRIERVKNTDPSKALSLTRTATTANRAFNSAEISRATTAVRYGDMSNRDKYGRMLGLFQAAVANGDNNLAQSLEGQLASLSVQIQNEEQAAARAAEGSANKTYAANKRGIDQTLRQYDQWEKQAKAEVEAGRISVQDYETGLAQAMEGKRQLLEAASRGEVADITPEAADLYASRAVELTSGDRYRDVMGRYPQAQAGNPTQYLSINPSVKNADGSFAGALKKRPAGKVELDANGNYVQTYSGGFQGKETKADREKFVEQGGEYVFNQVSRDAKGNVITTPTPVGGTPIKDAKGRWFVVDQNGKKHYVNMDPNATLQRSSTPIDEMPDFGPSTTAGQLMKPVKDAVAGIDKVAAARTAVSAIPGIGGILSGGIGILNNLFSRNDAAVKAKQEAELKAQQEAMRRARELDAQQAAARAAQSAKLLPVFRPAPLPAPTAATKTPKLAPLPGQPGYQSGVTRALNTPLTGNKKVDAFRGIEALRGGIY